MRVTSGVLRVANCDLRSEKSSCVRVEGRGAAPEFTSCRVHGAGWSGFVLSDFAGGLIRDCDVVGNRYRQVSGALAFGAGLLPHGLIRQACPMRGAVASSKPEP